MPLIPNMGNHKINYLELWKAAIEWDRKYLAGLAESIPDFDGDSKYLTPDEILKGTINE